MVTLEQERFIIIKERSSRSLLDKLSSGESKQKAREVMSMSVAIVLGFNIGGGNIRDRLKSDDGKLSFIDIDLSEDTGTDMHRLVSSAEIPNCALFR